MNTKIKTFSESSQDIYYINLVSCTLSTFFNHTSGVVIVIAAW